MTESVQVDPSVNVKLQITEYLPAFWKDASGLKDVDDCPLPKSQAALVTVLDDVCENRVASPIHKSDLLAVAEH